jgi:hypothetical protein
MCAATGLWLEYVKALGPVFVALVIGVIAARIAWQQKEVAKAKLNLDLFDKRYAIFKRTEVWLSEMATTATVYRTEIPELADGEGLIVEASFLFGPAIAAYQKEIIRKWNELIGLSGAGFAKAQSSPEWAALAHWFRTEANGGVQRKFGPYMSFAKWK